MGAGNDAAVREMISPDEKPYAGFRRDYNRAVERFRVMADTTQPVQSDLLGTPGDRAVRIVHAEAATGSRYVVVATPLGWFGRQEGGPVLVSVVWPWQDCKVMQYDGTLVESYVAEHLTDGRAQDGRLNGGDLAALTLAVRRVLGREGDLDEGN